VDIEKKYDQSLDVIVGLSSDIQELKKENEQLKAYHMEVKGFIDKNEELNEEIVQLKEKLQAKEMLDKNVKILVRQQAKKVKHLFPLENIAGYGQLCDKVLEQEKEIEYLQNELKKFGY
jgi:FtsZ-binding cell division protein ZapB